MNNTQEIQPENLVKDISRVSYMGKNRQVIIIGAGGHAKVIADIVKASGDEVVGFLDDDPLKLGQVIFEDKKVLGSLADFAAARSNYEFVIAIGNNATRAKIAERYPDLKYHTAIHPSATIGTGVEIAAGTVVMPGAVINADTKIGAHCIINTHVTVEHDNIIGDFVHLSPGATLCGTVNVGNNSWICTGTTVINNISIAADTTVGAGAVVIKNITEPGKTYVGIPAMLIKRLFSNKLATIDNERPIN